MATRIPSAHMKLKYLCDQCGIRGGKLTTFRAVAEAVGLSEGRVSQLFRLSNPEAEASIKLSLVSKIVSSFRDEGFKITIEDFCERDYESFLKSTAHPDISCFSSLSTPSSIDGITGTIQRKIEWAINEPVNYSKLAIVNLHRPEALNSGTESYYLNVSIRFEPTEYPYEDETLVIGLDRAVVTFASLKYQIAHNSLLGDCDRHWEGISPGITGVTITPKPGADMLSGSPLGGCYLAIIEPREGDDSSVGIYLEAPQRSFVYRLLAHQDETPKITPTKAAILNLVYKEASDEHFNPDTNRYRLAEATMQHKIDSNDNEN